MAENELTATDDAPVPGAAPITPKEQKFCEAFANPESATFGNARKSAEAAGYREPHNAGWKLRRRPRIIAKLREYHAAVTVAVGRVLADLENERRLAVEKGDIASAIRASELMGKHLGMFYESHLLPPAPPREYDPVLAIEARRITAILLMTPPDPALLPEAPPGPAVVEAQAQEQAPPARATPAELAALERKPQAPRERQGE